MKLNNGALWFWCLLATIDEALIFRINSNEFDRKSTLSLSLFSDNVTA
jgi:hypothetical protein